MEAKTMTVPVSEALLETGDRNSFLVALKWQMAAAKADEPAKIVLKEDMGETTPTGTTTPGSVSGDDATSGSDDDSASWQHVPPPPGLGFPPPTACAARPGLPRQCTSEKAGKRGTECIALMSGISPAYTERMLLEELQDGGFQAPRDFDDFLMPTQGGKHAGCCFIYFVDEAIRNAFLSAFKGFPLRLAEPEAPCIDVQPASTQALDLLCCYVNLSQQAGQVRPPTAPRRVQYCPMCGNHAGSRVNFCSQCGTQLR
jgi:hypothetical protein